VIEHELEQALLDGAGPGVELGLAVAHHAVGGFMYYNAYGPSSAVVGNSWAVMLGMDLRF
jgi:hypothetical protein